MVRTAKSLSPFPAHVSHLQRSFIHKHLISVAAIHEV